MALKNFKDQKFRKKDGMPYGYKPMAEEETREAQYNMAQQVERSTIDNTQSIAELRKARNNPGMQEYLNSEEHKRKQREYRQRALELARSKSSSNSDAKPNAGDDRTTAYKQPKTVSVGTTGLGILPTYSGMNIAANGADIDYSEVNKKATENGKGWKGLIGTKSEEQTISKAESLEHANEVYAPYANNKEVTDLFNQYVDWNDKLEMDRMTGNSEFSKYHDVQNKKKTKKEIQKLTGLSSKEFDHIAENYTYIRHDEQRKQQQSDIDNASGWKKGALTVGNALGSTIGNYYSMFGALKKPNDPELGRDYNSAEFFLSNLNRDTKEAVHNDIDDSTMSDFQKFAAGFSYDALTMGAESATSQLFGGAGLASYFAGGYASALEEAEERGLTKGQAQGYALASGGLEYATEKIPWEGLRSIYAGEAVSKDLVKGSLKPYVKAFLKQSGEEAGEEVVNGLGDLLADSIINADKSKLNISINNYVSQGYSEEDAMRKAFMDEGQDILYAAASAFASTGASAGPALGVQAYAETSTGRDIAKNSDSYLNNAESQEFIANTREAYNTDEDYNKALETRQKLQQAAEQAAQKKRISGKAARAITSGVREAYDNMNAKARVVFQQQVEAAQEEAEKENRVDEYKAPEKSQNEIIEDIEYASTPYQLAKAIESVTDETEDIKELIDYKKQELETYNFKAEDVENAITPKKAFEMGQRGEEVTEEQLKSIPEVDRQEVLENNNIQYNKAVLREHPDAVVDRKTGKYFVPEEVKVNGSDIVVVDSEGNEHVDFTNPRISKVENIFSKVSKSYDTGRPTGESLYNTTVQQAAYATEMAIKSPEATPALIATAAQRIFDSASVGNKTWSEFVDASHGLFTTIDQKSAEKLFNDIRNQARKSDSQKTENTEGKRTHNETVSKTLKENLNEESVALLEAFGKKIGYDFVASKSKNARGDINPSTRTISVGTNNISELWSIATHEGIAEYLQAHGNEADVLAIQDDMLKYLENKLGTIEYNNLIDTYQAAYRTGAKEGSVDAGKSRRAAANEMFNDTVFALMSSEEGLNDFIDWVTDNRTATEQVSILQRVKDFFSKIFDFIQNYIDSGSFNAAEKAALEMDAKQARELRDRIFKAMDEAIANRDAVANENADSIQNRHSKNIKPSMTEEERYEVLRNLEMTVPRYNNQTLPSSNDELIALENKAVNEVKKALSKMAKQMGITQERFYHPQIKFELKMSGNSVDKSANSQAHFSYPGRTINFLKMITQAKLIVENAKLLEMHTDKEYHTKIEINHRKKPNLKYGYELISAFETDNEIVPVKITVREFNNDENSDGIYVFTAYEGIKKGDVMKVNGSDKALAPDLSSPLSNIKLAPLLEKIKQNSVNYAGLAKYIPEQFVNSEDYNNDRLSNSRKSISVDTNGRSLSEGQQNYFSDSKVVDEDGNLKVVYHGTMNDFTVFDLSQARDTEDIEAFFFSGDYDESNGYGNVGEYYLNITNPADYDTAYDIFFKHKGEEHAGRLAREELEALGYDGVIAVDEDSPEYTEYLAFYPEQIKRTNNTNPTEDRDVRRSLAGIKAKTSDMVTLTEAEDMLADGEPMNEIFAKTGWFKGADNKWRFEISNLDSDVYKDGTALFANEPDYIRMNELRDKINAPMSDDYDMNNWMQDFEELGKLMDKYKDLAPKNGFRLEDILKNDALFEAYPPLRRIKVVFEDLGEEKINGSWHESENAIYLDSHFLKDFKHSLKRTLFHEIQHAIQDLEGFAGGSNVNYWEFRGGPTYYDADAKQKYNAAVDELEKIENEAPKDFLDKYHQHRMLMAQYGGLTANEEFYELAMNIEEELRNKDEKLFDALDDATFNVDVLQPELLELTPEEAYHATAGEIEAREVSDRINMSDEERRNNLPNTKDENGRVVFTENFVNPWEPRKSKKVDTEGRTISPAMQQFLSDNASVFYEDGAVKNYYHGTRYAGFTQFDLNRMDDKQSIFLTDSKKVAKTYSGTFEMFEPDREWSFDELDSALSYMTGGDWELEEIDNGYQITKYGDEAGQETVETYTSLKQVQEDFIDNYLNKVDLQSGEGGGIYNVYVHSSNPLVVEADGNYWDELPSLEGTDLHTTREYASYAKEHGYDSVVFNNMIDTAVFGNTTESLTPSQVVIVFDSNQVKSVYNENPTSDADIRKSIKVDWDSHNNYEVPARTYDDLVGFNGTDEEIEAAEQQDLAVKAYYANIIHSKNFAGLMFEFKDGNRTKQNFLTRSTRKGYDWQYSYGFDNEPHGHNNYKDVNDVVETYGSVWGDDMTSLYQELLEATPKEGVKVHVVREGIAENARNSFKVYGEASPYADSISESKVVAAMIGSMNKSLQQADVFTMPNDELLRLERYITNKYKVDMNSIEEGEIAANISYAFAYMQRNKLDTDYDNMMNYLLNVGDEIIKNSSMKDPLTEEIYNSTRAKIAGHYIKLTDADRAEISNAFGGSWKAAFGAINKAGIRLDNKNGIPVDDIFSEIKQEVLETAGIDLTEADKPSQQILTLIDTMTALEPTAYLWDGANDMDKALTVVADIVEQYYAAATEQLEKNVIKGTKEGKAKVKKAVDKESARLRGEWAKYKKQKQQEFNEIVAEKNRLIQQQQNEIRHQNELMKTWNADKKEMIKKWKTEQKEQAKKWKADQKEKDKLNREQRILTEKQMKQTARLQAQQAVQSYKDRQERAKQIDNIRKTGIRLIKWLSNPTDAQHVPDFLQKPLGEFLASIDFLPKNPKADAKNTLSWQQRMNSLREVLRQIDDAEKNGENTPQAYFAQNIVAKELISMMDDFLGKETWDEYTQSYIVSKRAATKVSRLDAKDLATLNKIMSALSASINNMNKTYANDQFKEISKLSKSSVEEIDKLPARKDMQKMMGKVFNFLNFDELEAITYFEGLGKGAKSVFDELRQGFNTKTRHVRETDEYITKAKQDLGLKDSEISKWKYQMHEFDLTEGKILMNTNQIMSLYEILKRKQGKPHVAIGGIKVADFEYGDGVKKKTHHQAKAIHIMSSEAQAIIDTLTDDQKAFADAMQQYMATECASWGNRVTEKMYGYKKYEEKDYFPLQTDAHTRATTASSDNNVSYYTIKNASFTKAITPMANNAVVVDDIFDVFTDHVVKMADYDAYVMPIADAMRWFNYSEKLVNAIAPDELNEAGQRVDYIGNMQESIDRVYGDAGLNYFKQFIKDINGDYAGKGGKSEILNSLMSLYKAQAVGANIRVVIQQPTAVVRAADVIESKYLLQAMSTIPNAMKYAEKAQKNSEIAYWKAQGYYETYLGQSFKEIMTGDTTLKDRINDLSGWAAGKADDLSWGIMYHAAELKVKKTMPQLKVDSEEFTKEVVKIFEDIVDHTQVVDTIFHKSQWMRSQELGHKITSAFMAEPTKTYNMLYRAYRDAKLSGDKVYAIKRLSKVAKIFVFEQMLNAIVTALWDALRDDEKEDYLSSLKEHFIDNAKGNLNVLEMIPIAKDIFSFFEGYDATSYIYDGLESLVQTMTADKKYLTNWYTGEKQSKTTYGISYQNAKAFSQLTGVPVANIMRDTVAIYNAVNDIWEGEDFVKSTKTQNKVEKAKETDRLTEVFDSNNLSSITAEITNTYNNAIESGKDESDAWGATRTMLKEQYLRQLAEHPGDKAALENRYCTLVSKTKHSVSGEFKNYTEEQARKQYIDKWNASLEK